MDLSFMSQICQSHLFNTNEINVFQVIAELIKSNGGEQAYQAQWQDSDSNELTQPATQDIGYIDITLLADVSTDTKSKVVVFGDLTWQKLYALESELTGFTSVAALTVSKPSEHLDGAFVYHLQNEVSATQKESLQQWSEQNEVELCVVDNAPVLNQTGLLVMDMDSTAIQIECIDEIAKLAGVGEQVAEVTAKAMRGELDFAESLRARVGTLTDAPVSVIDQVADNLPLMPGLENLVAALKDKGWKIVVASGGFTYMTEVLKRDLGLDKTVANQLEMADGKLTGNVLGDIVDAQTKADTVVGLAQEWNIPLSQTVAMGDGANDLTMMAAANLGVAFHAKPLVRKEADVSVRNGGLDQLLYLL